MIINDSPDISNYIGGREAEIGEREFALLQRVITHVPESAPAVSAALNDGKRIKDVCLCALEFLCSAEARNVAVIYSKQVWSSLGSEFVTKMSNRGFNVLLFSLKTENDDVPGIYPIDRPLLERLSRKIGVFIGFELPVWLTWNPRLDQDTRCIDIPRHSAHKFSLPESGTVDDYSFMRLGGYLVRRVSNTCDNSDEDSRTIYLNPEVKIPKDFLGARRTTHVLPLVSNKIERIWSIRQTLQDADIDRILVCPSASFVPGSFVKRAGKTIVGELLDAFPKYKVVYRPRPDERALKENVEIKNAFGNNERFICDESDDYADQYARGVLMVTDVSKTAQTFSLATGQPFIAYPIGGAKMLFYIEEMRGRNNCAVLNVAELIAEGHKRIAESAKGEREIQDIWDKYYGSTSSFDEKFYDYLEDVVRDRANGDWYTIQITDESIVGDSANDYGIAVKSLLERNGFRPFRVLRIMAAYLDKAREEQVPVPSEIIRLGEPVFARAFKSHRLYGWINQFLYLLFHNISLGEKDDRTISALMECTKLVFQSEEQELHEKVLRDIDAYESVRDVLEARGVL